MAPPVSWAEAAEGREPLFQDCRVAPAEAACLFLDLKPRGRYVMWHSWGNPLRRHCVQGAVPLHFFLLSLQNEHAVQNRNHKSVNHVLHQTSGTRSIPTLCRSLALTLVDFWSRHVNVVFTRTCDEDGGRSGVSCQTPHETDAPIARLASGVHFCIDPSKAMARTTASRPLSDFVQPLADPAGVVACAR